MDRIIEVVTKYGQIMVDYLIHPEVLAQIGIIALLFPPALLLSRRVEPILVERARAIKGMPGLLRIIVAFLRRFEWLFFIALLGLAYVLTKLVGWPARNNLIYGAMMLSLAWFLIDVISHAIRSRAVRKLFAGVAWIYVAAAFLGIVEEAATLLDRIGFSIGSVRFSMLVAVKGAIVLAIVLWAALSLGNFADKRINAIEELTPSLRVLLGKITRITLIIVAGLAVISGLGIDLTALTVLSGAVGVGIGFGLQKVVSNFISGIIILLDESIKPGDTITLGDTFGWIRELRARFVSVVTRDGREFLIPNEDFITHEVINWSFSDKYVRLDVDFGVAYDSNPHDVMRLAIEAASAVPRVNSSYNAPVCWMTEFGDSSLNFKLRFWINDPQAGLTNIRGKVLLALWDTFKEHGIGIPFPHREVIFKTPIKVESVND